jgi:hypothetical protein
MIDSMGLLIVGIFLGIWIVYLASKHYTKKHNPKYKYHYDIMMKFGWMIHGDSNNMVDKGGVQIQLSKDCYLYFPSEAISWCLKTEC